MDNYLGVVLVNPWSLIVVDFSSDSNSWKNVRILTMSPIWSTSSESHRLPVHESLMLQIHNIIVGRSIDVFPTKIVSIKYMMRQLIVILGIMQCWM